MLILLMMKSTRKEWLLNLSINQEFLLKPHKSLKTAKETVNLIFIKGKWFIIQINTQENRKEIEI